MEAVGIICEYNPFHNGHLYHLKKTKEMFPNDVVVLILNGYFLQRGELSILTKEEKTKLALEYGVDLVVELPAVFGTQSADIFAYYSIKLLNELKVSNLVFGSESNNIQLLEKITDIELNDQEYDQRIKDLLAKGMNYPTAMAKALNIEEDIDHPNDLLGISYLKAIKKLNSKIQYHTIQRTNDYHDTLSDNELISATNIRKKLKNKESITKFVPAKVLKYLKNINDDYFSLLKYKIITDQNLAHYLDVDEGIENRLRKYITKSNNLTELINNIKTKRYTYNKLNRMFIHILMGLSKEDNKKLKLDYLNILGFNEKGKKYLNKIKKDLKIAFKSSQIDSLTLKYEKKAALVYDLITGKNTVDFEISNKPISK